MVNETYVLRQPPKGLLCAGRGGASISRRGLGRLQTPLHYYAGQTAVAHCGSSPFPSSPGAERESLPTLITHVFRDPAPSRSFLHPSQRHSRAPFTSLVSPSDPLIWGRIQTRYRIRPLPCDSSPLSPLSPGCARVSARLPVHNKPPHPSKTGSPIAALLRADLVSPSCHCRFLDRSFLPTSSFRHPQPRRPIPERRPFRNSRGRFARPRADADSDSVLLATVCSAP